MAPALRFWALLLAACVALAGLALGAMSQKETFLQAFGARDPSGAAAGNLVLLTALIVGVGLGAMGLILARRPLGQAWPWALLLVVVGHATTVLVQSNYPNYQADVDARVATLAVNPLIHQEHGAASAYLGPVGLAVGLLLLLGRCMQGLLGRGDGGPLLPRHMAAWALAASVSTVAIAGSLRLLFEAGATPGHEVAAASDVTAAAWPGIVMWAAVLHGAFILAALGLLGTQAWKARHLAALEANPRLRTVVAHAWQRTGRLELGLVAAICAVALLGFTLPVARLDVLAVGRTWEISLRGHAQLLVMVLVALVPAWGVHMRGREAFEAARPTRTIQLTGPHPAFLAGLVATATALVAGCAVSLAGLGTTGLGGGALWPWLAVLMPWAAVALVWGHPSGVTVPLLLGLVLWGIGNTVIGSFDGRTSIIELVMGPEILALWRVAAVVAVGAAVVRVLQPAALAMRPSLRWPLSLATALGIAAVVLLELPQTAWLQQSAFKGEEVGIGSVVAAQDLVIQVLMHVLAVVAALLATASAARILRPDWFPPRRPRGAPVHEAQRRPKADPAHGG